jgi:uncharacterized membrane protein
MDIKKISLYVLAMFYIVAGINHFVNPGFYFSLIPEYFVYLELINYLSGIAEVVLGIGLLFNQTRRISSYLIVLLLLAFIPSHVYFIQIGSCVDGGLCIPEWGSWLRLVAVHPFLIWWAWSVRNLRLKTQWT